MRKRCFSVGLLSVLICTNCIFWRGWVSVLFTCRAIESITGASRLQGPHHGAQNNASTGCLDCKTSVENVCSLTARTWGIRAVLAAADADCPEKDRGFVLKNGREVMNSITRERT